MSEAKFWDGIAARYAARPVDDPDAYAATLERVRAHLRPDDRVLEVGCGTGTTALKLADAAGEITATDFSPEMIRIARGKLAPGGPSNVAFEVAGAAGTGGDWDAILAMNLLHLLPDTRGTIRALRARLRPGGLLMSKTPCLGPKAVLLRPVIGVMRLFGKAPRTVRMLNADRLVETVRTEGFEIVETGDYPKGSRFIVARRPA